jgi:alpha-L-rhamnosidase
MFLFLFSNIILPDSPKSPTGKLIEVANNESQTILISDEHPEFGWIMNDPDQNEYQTAYQILLASKIDNLENNYGDMWDSGKKRSDESSNVSYSVDGKQLENGRMYYWKVRIWDKDDQVSPYSSTSKFITSLNKGDWSAKPIWDNSNAINEDVADFAYFRKGIKLPSKNITYAIAFVTSRDARIQKSPAYKFYINDELVGTGPFQGYNDKITYQAYEVTNFLNKDSVNILAAICESSVKEKDFLMQLYINYEKGDTNIVTDNKWKSFSAQSIYNPQGSKTSNAYHYIDPFENIDGRLIPDNWRKMDYDDSQWGYAREKHEFHDKLIGISKPNFEIEEISPTSIEYLGDGNYNIVLGSGYFGSLKLVFDEAVLGDTILIRGEQDVFPWKTVDWSTWIIGASTQTIEEVGYVWTDTLQIFGYGGKDTLDESNIKFIAIRNPFNDNVSEFSSSNSLLDEIYEFCKVSMKNLNVDFYWDTPQNERLAYEGGALIQQMTSYTMDREYALARFASEYQYYEPTWPKEYRMQSVLMAWEDYMYTGDIESLKKHWDIIRSKYYHVDSCSNYLIKNIAADALDWPKVYQDGYDNRNAREDRSFIDNIINAWNYFSTDHLAKFATILHENYSEQEYLNESIEFKNLSNKIKTNYNNFFYSKDLMRYVDGHNSDHASFHSSFMPIVFDLVPVEQIDDISSYLMTRDMDCGVFGSQFFLWSLYKINQGPKALSLITSDSRNSWYNMIYRLGAANTCEAWDPSGKPDMSKSHTWGSSAGNMIQRGLMGINPVTPGFTKISIKPQIGNLNFAELKCPSIKGSIYVRVFSDENSYKIEAEIPDNTTAVMIIKNYGGDDTLVEVDGAIIEGIAVENGEFIKIDNIGSGLHSFKRAIAN